MSSTSRGMDQAALGTAYNSVKAELDHAAGRRWRPLVAKFRFGATQQKHVDASDSARDDQRLGELMVGAQAGDKASYARLLRACDTLVRRAARCVGVQGDLIEDVVQETLVTMHNARQTYHPSRSFSAWLSTIARRRAIEALCRSGRRTRLDVHAPLVCPSQIVQAVARIGRSHSNFR